MLFLRLENKSLALANVLSMKILQGSRPSSKVAVLPNLSPALLVLLLRALVYRSRGQMHNIAESDFQSEKKPAPQGALRAY